MPIVSAFLEYASKEFGIVYPDNIYTDGNQHRYKLPADKGCFHVMPGNDKFVFVSEGYATGATIFELTGYTNYIAFDCGNLEDVCMAVIVRHPNAIKIVVSDDDRFTLVPIKNPGQTKAIDICSKTDFHNLKPGFTDNESGTD